MSRKDMPLKPFIAVLVLIVLFACHRQEDGKFYAIHKGQFKASITQSGELQAVKAKPIIMPFVGWRYGYRYKIIGLLEHGAKVSKGDSIAKIDPSSIMKYLIKEESDLEVQQAELNQMITREENRINNLKSQLTVMQLQYEQKKLEVEKYKFESERKQKIKALEFRQAQIRLNKILRKIELSRIVKKNNIKIQHIRIEKIKNNIVEANSALKQLTIRSPISGILQLNKNYRTRQLVKVGDEIWQGFDFARVPNLDKMKVESQVNEIDINKVYLGQKAIVRLDAFPEKTFHARISEIDKLSHKKSKQSDIKVFDIELMVEGSDVMLKPGMTVSCRIIYADMDEATYVATNCIRKESDRYFIYQKNGIDLVKYPVKLGPANDQYTVIYGDFQKGGRVVDIESL